MMSVKNKLVYGVGVNDYNGSVNINGKILRSYDIWRHVLQRVYEPSRQIKNISYIGCSVDKRWLKFSNFKSWYDANYPDAMARELGIKFELDKDLLVSGNKVYSPETCIFIPQNVNKFLSNKYSNNTSGYIGVSWHKKDNKWEARIRDFDTGKLKHLGNFVDVEDAANTYRLARELESIKVRKYLKDLGYSDYIINKIK